MAQPDDRTAARPATDAGRRAFSLTPFTRLARAHAASTMADAMVTASLAGSLFFTVPAGEARGPVLRYLVITMLPFGVLSPLIGPAIDRMRGGHRLMLIGSEVARAAVCYFMISAIGGDGPLFFLLALCILVAQKAYSVAKSALVPSVVDTDDELVQANSKLSQISGIAGFAGIVPAAIVLKVLGPEWSIGLAMVTYGVAAVLGARVPRIQVATTSADATERHELRGASIIMAGSAMGLIRMCVGFLAFLVAFGFRTDHRPAWQLGLVAGSMALSQLGGAALAPRVRSLTSEENLLTGAIAAIVAGAFLALVLGGLFGACLIAAVVGLAAGAGKQAFDAILQRDAPDANRGRAFARFETRFQVTWVLGALIPVLPGFHLGIEPGFGLVFTVGLFALGSYVLARLAYAHRSGSQRNSVTKRAVEIEDRFAEVSTEVKGRLAAAPRSVLRRLRSHGEDGSPSELDDPASAVGRRAAGAAGGADPDATPPTAAGAAAAQLDPADLAPRSRLAWEPPPVEPTGPTTTYPWEVPSDPKPVPGAFLEDVDPSVANPFPWTPDDATHVVVDDATARLDDDDPTGVVGAGPDRSRRRRRR